MRRLALGVAGALGAFAWAACSNAAEPPPEVEPPPEIEVAVLAELPHVPPTTLERTLVPKVAPRTAADGPNPSLPEALPNYVQMGYHTYSLEAGWPRVDRTLDGSPAPALQANRRRLVRFVHLPDLQLADDESPSRVGTLDMPTQIDAALRPQDPQLCRMVHAAVRTLRAHHRADPFEFVLLGGDNIDNAQRNELDWVLDILGGKPNITCDSGDRNDLIKGPANDGKDPFASAGLPIPFYWVTGNHDVNVQGNMPLSRELMEMTLGNSSPSGTRDYSKDPGGPVRTGAFVVPDARRELLTRQQIMRQVHEHQDGHGIGPAQVESGMAFYAFDTPGSPIRFLVLDTAHAAGGYEGMLRRSDLDRHVKPLLEQARADGKYVILTGHHSSKNLSRDGGPFGQAQGDALLEDEWLEYLAPYPNVIASLVGHTHKHQVRTLSVGDKQLWELMTSALADFPNQFRIVEVFDEGNEWLSIEATCADFDTTGDEVAEEGRRRAIIDYVSGWIGGGTGADDAHNVRLWVKKP